MTDPASLIALGRLHGDCRLIEGPEGTRIAGWARSSGAPLAPVVLELVLDGVALGSFVANLPRRDLAAPFPEYSDLGYSIAVPLPLGPARVEVRRAADLAPLPGSPVTLPAPERHPLDDLRALLDATLDQPAAERAALARRLAEALAALLPGRSPRQAALLARWGTAPPGPASPELPPPELPPPELPPPELPPPRRPQALFIDDGVPDPARDAGSAALISHMQALLRLGYEVGFVPALALGADGPAARSLTGMGVTCWQLPWIGSVEEVLRRAGPGLDLVYLHRFDPMRRYAALARHWAPAARLVYSVADLHWLRAEREQALLGAPGPGVAALRAAELSAVLAADAVITHSSHERALLARDAPEAAVHLLPWAVAPRPVTTPWAERRALGFIGSYGHRPNLDAAETLLAEIMPAIWARAPELPLLLAGSDLPAGLRAAAEAAPGPVEVLGHVADLAELWERCRLALAPLRYGAGLKGKVLDALAAGLPCLCTPEAAEGMDLPPPLQALICPDPAALAEAALALYPDEARCTALGAAGLAFIETRFGAAAIAEGMRGVVGGQ